jgi:uncharacterized glyoxalase superfamily protein PhnB
VTEGSLNVVGLVVSDLERSVLFYRRLGVPFPEGAEKSEHGHAAAPLGGGVQLMIDTEATIRSFDASWQPPSGPPRTSVAFECSSAAEVDALFAEAIEAGATAHKEPWDAFWGQRYAQLHDPDGHAVDLFFARPQGA